ncbi:DUF937 domain-containing protein [Methylobacterium haplocladii]|uniref:DUF937 domain-containing protein n=1 Tax=Methylobacterium haplocladii TaxID=1176176 RepID=A0A512IND2_9HYPH|nr:DUF937 domain-containing protein [Methylobacterium haplocladii]GEO99148.1 hypothetical protein MHA02_15360 [Methylobacterium haplocladii]GJD83897.1 hypothetical protein HPGCJGGD_1771 [Methylobacterium haplocladii]GLS58528.1 hypothetical protein GCM10007887_11910 [Methylobacterium haplocladii]
MFNLFDILQSQAGPGMQSIGQQFGLTPEQSRSAMNALLPALATGLQRSAASDPMGFGRMLGMAGANPYFGAPPQPQAAAQPDFLNQIFGSSMLSQAVLQQASATSGIGQQALRQMLPVMAGMVVAGIVHVLVNQPPPAPAQPQRQTPPPAPDAGFPVATFWNDWINQFVGAPASSGPAATTSKPREAAPAPQPAAAELPKPGDMTLGDKDDAPFEAFQQMFQTGVQVQEQNAKAMQDIFEAFWSPPAEADVPGSASAAGSKDARDQGRPADAPVAPAEAASRKRPIRPKEH